MSHLEQTLAMQIRALRLPEPEQEHRFAPPRKWRFDFCWPERMLAVEIEGGTWSGGRHNRPEGFQKDAEKYNAAALNGWTVLRFTGKDVKTGTAISMIERALEQ